MSAPREVSRAELFFGFLTLGALGFGGIAPWARHVLVEQRRWIDDAEFAEYIGLGQILPGANTVNAAVLIGQRFGGGAGATIAVVALMTVPVLVLIVLAALYGRFGELPAVRAALVGTTAGAAGMVFGNAVKIAWRLRPTAVAVAVAAVAFLAAGVARLPMIPVLLALIPVSIGATFVERRR